MHLHRFECNETHNTITDVMTHIVELNQSSVRLVLYLLIFSGRDVSIREKWSKQKKDRLNFWGG